VKENFSSLALPGRALPVGWHPGSPSGLWSQCSAPPWFLSPQSLELIRKHGFSAALFAPGWVYECLEKSDFFQNQDK
jgi:hypothetical protein